MARPTLYDNLSDRQRLLVANMQYHNEPFDLIIKYIDMNDTPATRLMVEDLGKKLETPMSDALYMAHLDLAQTEHIMGIAAAAAETKSPRHMSEYQKLGAHKIKLVSLIDELMEREAERGRIWEPSFDLNSPEFRIFKAAMELALTKKDETKDDFDELKPEDQAKFFQILAESA